MAASDPERELTTTLHLGLRSVVAHSPATVIEEFYNQASAEEQAIIASTLAAGNESAMVFIHRGPQRGARFHLPTEGAKIGRSPECSIFLNDVTVSRTHALIEKVGKQFTFKDLGSLNGSYINNESVSEKVLVTGDEIQVGKFHLLFIGASTSGEK